jgi:erythromycin esterase-like protein
VGDARATELGTQGQTTLGALSRAQLGSGAYLVGFGTDHGTVSAAREWGGEVEGRTLRPARAGSYEALCHDTDQPAFLLHLTEPAWPELRGELEPARLERAVGVVYRPETELESHYFQASLPGQFDSWVWFDETSALDVMPRRSPPEGET